MHQKTSIPNHPDNISVNLEIDLCSDDENLIVLYLAVELGQQGAESSLGRNPVF